MLVETTTIFIPFLDPMFRTAAILLLTFGPGLVYAAQDTGDQPLRPAPDPLSEESRAINGLLSGMATVTTRFADANANLCEKGNLICHVTLTIRDVSTIGIEPTNEGMSLTVPLLKYVKNDDELAFILAHEQAHRLLHHVDRAMTHEAEVAADCLGTFLAARAGYDPIKGADTIRRVAQGQSREEHVFAASGNFGTKLKWEERMQTIRKAADAAKAGAEPAIMNQTCGVSL